MTTLLTLSTVLALVGPAPADDPDEAPVTTAPTADPAAPGPGALGDAPPSDPPGDPPPTDAATELSDGASEGEDPGDAPDADAPATSGDARAPGLPATTRPAPAPTTMAPVKNKRPPRPIRWRLDLGLGFGSTVVGDRGYLAFSEGRNLPGSVNSIIFDFRLGQSRLFLGGGLAYQRVDRDGGSAYQQVGTELTLNEPEILGRLSIMAIEGIDAFARVGVGPSFADMQYYSQQNATQTAVLPRIDSQAGLSLYLPKAWLPRKQAARVTGGLNLGLGYVWRGRVDAQPALEQGDEPLPAQTSPWGDLSLGGLSWSVGLFVRVM